MPTSDRGGTRMKARTFFIAVLAGVAACFGAMLLLVSASDPFFILSGVDEGEVAVFDNQRYQMAGLIRHQDYSAVVMGTSLVANYRASWFTEGLGEQTLKITFPDGWISEFDTALDLAFRTHPDLDTVYFGLDPNILIRPDSQRTVELPRSLYSVNPLDDVEFLLNADTIQSVAQFYFQGRGAGAVPLDEAYVWDGAYRFSKEDAIAGFGRRPEQSGDILPADAYLAVADGNLDVVCRWMEEHPDVRFVFWYPPYSILYWDLRTREGSAQAILTAVERAAQRLLSYDNASVYSFLQAEEIITDLDNYCDHIHCSGAVTRQVAAGLMDGAMRLTPENCRERMDELRRFTSQYDYDSIFEG